MRTILIISTVALALGACGKTEGAKGASASASAGPGGATASTSGAVSMPTRRSGLWIQTMSEDGAPNRMGQVRECVDPSTDAKMMAFSQKVGRRKCQQRSMSRGLDGSYTSASICSLGGAGTITSKGTISGDFSSKYHVRSESDISGAPVAAMNGHHVTDIEGVYSGPCPADMTPGDVALGNGMKMNIDKFPGGGGSGAPPQRE